MTHPTVSATAPPAAPPTSPTAFAGAPIHMRRGRAASFVHGTESVPVTW